MKAVQQPCLRCGGPGHYVYHGGDPCPIEQAAKERVTKAYEEAKRVGHGEIRNEAGEVTAIISVPRDRRMILDEDELRTLFKDVRELLRDLRLHVAPGEYGYMDQRVTVLLARIDKIANDS